MTLIPTPTWFNPDRFRVPLLPYTQEDIDRMLRDCADQLLLEDADGQLRLF